MAATSVLRANLRASGKRLRAAAAAITVSVAFIVTGMTLAAPSHSASPKRPSSRP